MSRFGECSDWKGRLYDTVFCDAQIPYSCYTMCKGGCLGFSFLNGKCKLHYSRHSLLEHTSCSTPSPSIPDPGGGPIDDVVNDGTETYCWRKRNQGMNDINDIYINGSHYLSIPPSMKYPNCSRS